MNGKSISYRREFKEYFQWYEVFSILKEKLIFFTKLHPQKDFSLNGKYENNMYVLTAEVYEKQN